jgi:hypothetical protein
MTRRAPQRSTSHPITGQDNADKVECKVSADENVARPTPSSAVIGFRNTPNANTLTAPPPTMRPQTVANTIHQRFAKIPRIGPPPYIHCYGQVYCAADSKQSFLARYRKGGCAESPSRTVGEGA